MTAQGAATAPPLLEASGVSCGYGKAVVLSDVDVQVPPGEIVALLGPNGAGKTTFVRAVCGLIPLRSGRLRFAGEEITSWRSEKRLAAGMTLVPEGRQVFPGMSVEDNLALGAFPRLEGGSNVGKAAVRYLGLRHDVKRWKQDVYDTLPRLHALRRQDAAKLSGGEQQMVALGRALMGQPKLLLVDELSLGLAPLITQGLAQHLREIRDDRGVSVLLIEQNMKLALALSAVTYVLEAGRVTWSGPSSDLERQLAQSRRGDEEAAGTPSPVRSSPRGAAKDRR